MLKDNFNFLDNKLVHCCAIEDNFKNRIDGYFAQIFKENTKDGNIMPTKQGKTGNCWVLSAINALSYCQKGREIISRALEYKKGYTIVHTFCGDYVVLNYETELTKTKDIYSYGDDDMIIFELALEKIIDDYANKRIRISKNASYLIRKTLKKYPTVTNKSSTNLGHPGACFYFLTGIEPRVTINHSKINEYLNKLKDNNAQDFAMCATSHATFKEKIRDIKHRNVCLHSNHAYSIKSFDGENVTVVNPHDSSLEIILTKAMFFKMFANVQVCDLTLCKKSEYFKPKMFYNQFGKPYKTIEVDDNNFTIQYDYIYNKNGKLALGKCQAVNPDGIYVVCVNDISKKQKYIINGNKISQLALARIYKEDRLVEMRFGSKVDIDSSIDELKIIPIEIGNQIKEYDLYQYNDIDCSCIMQIAQDIANGNFDSAFEYCNI